MTTKKQKIEAYLVSDKHNSFTVVETHEKDIQMKQSKEESKKKKSSNHLKEANAWVKKYREKHPNANQATATKLYWEKKKKGESLSL